MSDFNRIAPLYDTLAQLVYGNSIYRSSRHFLSGIPSASQILILGGGTGRILTDLPADSEVHFVDPSQKMIDRAKKRVSADRNIRFYTQKFEDFQPSQHYDYILCPFFLDLFQPDQLEAVLTKILSSLKDNGQLIVSDFNIPKSPFKSIKKALLFLTIWFFRISTGLNIKSLPDIKAILEHTGFQCMDEVDFRFGMIFSSKWIKTKH